MKLLDKYLQPFRKKKLNLYELEEVIINNSEKISGKYYINVDILFKYINKKREAWD